MKHIKKNYDSGIFIQKISNSFDNKYIKIILDDNSYSLINRNKTKNIIFGTSSLILLLFSTKILYDYHRDKNIALLENNTDEFYVNYINRVYSPLLLFSKLSYFLLCLSIQYIFSCYQIEAEIT